VTIVCEAAVIIVISSSNSGVSNRIKLTSALQTTTRTIPNYGPPAMTLISTLNYRTLAPALTLWHHLMTCMRTEWMRDDKMTRKLS